MKVFSVWAVAALLVAAAGTAAAKPDETPSVVVTGRAEVRASPDKATLNVAAEVKTETVADGEAQVQRQVKALLQRLAALKIPDDRIDSAQVSIRPENRWNEEARRNEPDGYRVRRDIRIELTDLSLLGPVLKAVTASGITEEQLNTGGLQITTTIDQQAQSAAVKAAANMAENQPKDLRTAIVSVDPKTGGVLAYYGGSDGNGYDRVQAGLQTGSSFKVFALVAGLEQGIGLSRVYSSSPFKAQGVTVNNSDGESCGSCNLATAMKMSLNTVYYRLERIAELCERLGNPQQRLGGGAGGRGHRPLGELLRGSAGRGGTAAPGRAQDSSSSERGTRR